MTVMMMNKTVFGGDQPRAAGMSVTSSFITDCSATGSTERERGGEFKESRTRTSIN